MNNTVSGEELKVTVGRTIVFKTDLYGTITYVNDAFINMSVYASKILVAQLHNTLRTS
jgi:hypothetical protein